MRNRRARQRSGNQKKTETAATAENAYRQGKGGKKNEKSKQIRGVYGVHKFIFIYVSKYIHSKRFRTTTIHNIENI